MLVALPGVLYVARGAICSPAHVLETKRMIRRAFELQQCSEGLTLVEVLSPCPSGWALAPVDALKFVAEKMISFSPLGELKTPDYKI
jgi:2-oxoglutarate ferredoxin oxidoreductase subunit beta